MSTRPSELSGTAIVTGGGGFVGRALCKRLRASGLAVRSVARGDYAELRALGIETVRADLSDQRADLRSIFAGAEVVFHTAAKVEMWGKYDDFYRANVLGTQRVIEACRASGVRHLVFTSSPSVVSGRGDLCGVSEEEPYPASYLAYYPQTKAQAEKLVLAAHSAEGLRTIALRPHLIFGPGDTNLIPTVLEKARTGKLRIIGNGLNLVDFTYIDDCVSAHIDAWLALKRNALAGGRAYFISQGDAVRLWWWINEVLRRSGMQPITRKIKKNPALTLAYLSEAIARILPGRTPALTRFLVHEMSTSHYFDISAARKELGFHPSVSVAQALDLTFADTDSPQGSLQAAGS